MWVSSLPIGAEQLEFIDQYGEIHCAAMRLIDGDSFAGFLFPTQHKGWIERFVKRTLDNKRI